MKNPRMLKRPCHWCGRPVRKRRLAGEHFCTCGCAVRYANAAVKVGLAAVAAAPANYELRREDGTPFLVSAETLGWLLEGQDDDA